jgi:hypothetical protein
VFGQAPVFVSPPTFDDGGLARIQPSAAPAFDWSINNTTNSDVNLGAEMTQISAAGETYHMRVASGVGDHWLDIYKQAGYVILFRPPVAQDLGPKLDFFVTMDPQYVVANAAYDANDMVVVGGNDVVIQAAKAIMAGGDAPLPQVPPQLPPPSDAGGCPEGQIGIPPFCVTVPGGLPSLPGGTLPPPGAPAPPVEPEPGAPRPGTPSTVTKAGVGSGSGMLIAALIAVGAISIFAIIRMREVESTA